MATAAQQKHPFLPGSNTDEFDQGSKAAPAFRKARKRAGFLPLPFHCHPLFQFFFFPFGALRRGLTYHTWFSSENNRLKCVLFSGVSPDSPIGHIAYKSGCLWERHAKRNPDRDSGLQRGCQDTRAMRHTAGGLPSSTHTGFMNKSRGCTAELLISAALLFVALLFKYLVWKPRKLNWHCPNWQQKFVILYSPFAFLLLKMFQTAGQRAKALLENLFQGWLSRAADSSSLHWAKSPTLHRQYSERMH